MTRAAPTEPRPISRRIGSVLRVVAGLIAYARHFAATAAARVAVPEFATAAAVLGTYDLPTILHRMRRGMLRALALQEYLLARAARGRDLRFLRPPYSALQPHRHPPAKPQAAPQAKPIGPRRPEPALLSQDDPRAFRLPTNEELAAETRRRPVGRTIAYICLDLGIAPGLCEGEFWYRIGSILRHYGGSLDRLYRVRRQREENFQRERDRRPETWHIDWRDMHPSTVRRALGYRIGEPPPAIVPS